MSEFDHNHGQIDNADLSHEMRTSFLDYAMSVIVSRALPDVRDGLKPVHRRILYGMNELGNTPDKSHKKSARIVGDVMGKYHPHGDSAIYDSMVRMAQDFSYRYELVDGHGNFGSIDGDGAAAMRYTEARLSKIAMEMLRDINKNTIDFQDNYDGNEREPVVLPARFPNLLVNGASGIAVGMATNIPPHNLNEVIAGLRMLMDNPDVTTSELMEAIPGPDFPTGATVLGKTGIHRAYETGRGSITIRAKASIEEDASGREEIVVTEIPYMTNKSKMVKKIAELAREKEIDGISSLNDLSDRNGINIRMGIRRDASAKVVLNNLYKKTAMQTSFSFNMLAIVDGVPRTLSLKEILQEYLKHQQEVIKRRTQFDLDKAEQRAHILEGLQIALDHIDDIINIIRSSQESQEAKEKLMTNYQLSDRQAQAILDMRLVRLTGLEREKIDAEHAELMKEISYLKSVLADPKKIDQLIYDELLEIAEKHGDERRTKLLVGEVYSMEDEDLIEEEEIIITLTHNDYVKRMDPADFKTQNRGGRGIKGMATQEEDFVEHMLSCRTHDELLFFTNKGKVYRAKGYEIPEYGRTAKGLPIINLINLDQDEKVQAIGALDQKPSGDEEFFFITKKGTVKRTSIEEFKNIRQSGIIAIKLKDDDELVDVLYSNGQQTIIIGSKLGYSVTFKESEVRSMGRTAGGVRGINLREGDEVIGASVLDEDDKVFVVTENGYGKVTDAKDYPIRKRGGKGIKTANITEKNGPLVSLKAVKGDEDCMIITSEGIMIRFDIQDVSKTGRVTQGIRLIRMDPDVTVTSVELILEEDDDSDTQDSDEVSKEIEIDDDTDDLNS